MTKLASLRSQLTVLRRRRQMVRDGMALTALLLAVLAVLGAAFWIDWVFDMTRLQRLLTLLLCAAVLGWAYRRFARPWLRVRESEVDMALLVERQQNIDGDLVAALQFEAPEARGWGSPQLRDAVIDYVAEFGKGLNVLEGFSARGLVRYATGLAVALVVVGLLTTAYPAHVSAFLNRFCLGSAHYPTRTVLDQVLVNGTPIDLGAGRDVSVRSAYGLPLRLEVHASGRLPEEGKMVVQSGDGRGTGTVKLAREAETEATFGAQLPEVVEALSLEVLLGDARTEPIRIEVVPLPVIETRAVVRTPEYAAVGPPTSQNARQLTAFEGSQIDLEVVSGNKRLTSVTLSVEGTPYALKPAPASPESGRVWTLPAAGSPLAAVTQPLHYEIQVTDEDGLHLPQPLRGAIRIKPDQRPQIAGGVLTRFVLPTAKPPIHYRASDDHGITQLTAHLDVTRKDGRTEDRRSLPLRSLPQPLRRDQLPFKGVFPLALEQLGLEKGDRLTVVLEAIDYRGSAAGQSALSEPIVFEIADEAGILEDIAKPDYRSAEELDAIIRQQLSIGGSR